MSLTFWVAADVGRAIDYGQRALALADTLGHIGLQARAHLSLGQVYGDDGDMHTLSPVWNGMWRTSRVSCALPALAPMASLPQPPGPI